MSHISRRGFIASLMAATASAAVLAVEDPERLLWEPGKKTFFIPDTPKIANLSETLLSERERMFFSQVLDPKRFDAEMRKVEPKLYMAERYVLSLSDRRSLVFDSDWKPKFGVRDGRPMSESEIRDMLRVEMKPSRR